MEAALIARLYITGVRPQINACNHHPVHVIRDSFNHIKIALYPILTLACFALNTTIGVWLLKPVCSMRLDSVRLLSYLMAVVAHSIQPATILLVSLVHQLTSGV